MNKGRVEGDAHISTELMVNGAPQSSFYFDATDYVGWNTPGTVVVQINQGDEVFVRTTKDSFNRGDILSDYMGRTYLGGAGFYMQFKCFQFWFKLQEKKKF